jgi:hypothetical protein
MNTIPITKPRKNKFDLSHEVKMTGQMGTLMPCYIQDVIPGDSYRLETQQMVRFSPLLAPVMHSIDFKIDYFFVPYRIIWSEWKDFITGGEDGNDLPSYPRFKVHKSLAESKMKKGSLADYMGIPPIWTQMEGDNDYEKKLAGAWTDVKQSNDFYLSILPFRAYQLIYHEYFRDQNVGTEWEQYTDSGIRTSQNEVYQTLSIRQTNWEKDYFTSALPFLQRGPDVELPLGKVTNFEPVDSQGNPLPNTDPAYIQGVGTQIQGNAGIDGYGDLRYEYTNANGTWHMPLDFEGSVESVTINELRKASALQQWLELMARAGSRYREQILAIFGERIPDYTVQIPKYLGGGKTPIMISEILSNYTDSTNPNDRPAGDMAGHALGLGDNLGFTQSFDEHGIILGIARVVPRTAYTQGLSKFWQKFDKFDHYFPQFANLGEQEVHKQELYVSGNPTKDLQIFGYQQRYAEYKYAMNRVAGDFRDTLSYWELSRRFAGAPNLNQSFIECRPDTRIFAIDDGSSPNEGHDPEDKLWISLYHKVDALRPMPYHSNPSLT